MFTALLPYKLLCLSFLAKTGALLGLLHVRNGKKNMTGGGADTWLGGVVAKSGEVLIHFVTSQGADY